MSWSDTICNCLRSSFVSFRYCVLVPTALDRAEAVDDADRVFLGVLTGGLGEDLVDELANAADARVWPTIQKDVAFGELADLRGDRNPCPDRGSTLRVMEKVVGGFQFRSHVRELHAEHGVRLQVGGQ